MRHCYLGGGSKIPLVLLRSFPSSVLPPCLLSLAFGMQHHVFLLREGRLAPEIHAGRFMHSARLHVSLAMQLPKNKTCHCIRPLGGAGFPQVGEAHGPTSLPKP